jgi:hypothetical protein
MEKQHMMTADTASTLENLLSAAQTVCIFFPEQASPDVILSAAALSQGLSNIGKTVTISSPGPIGERLHQFVGVGEVTSEIGNKNLDVSFPYIEDQVDKVSYHIDEESHTFHLVVQPKKGIRPLDPTQVQYTFSGADADLIFTIGLDQLDHLGHLYIGYEQLFSDTNIVSIHNYETSYGTLKITTEGSSSVAETVTNIFQQLNMALEAEIATNLLAGVETATQTFKSLAVSAQTFETAAKLLAAGARRVRLGNEPTESVGGPADGFAAMLGKTSQRSTELQPNRDASRPGQNKQKIKGDKHYQPSQIGGVGRN